MLTNGKKVTVTSLGLETERQRTQEHVKSSFVAQFPPDHSLNEITEDLKRFFINEALRESKGNRLRAAEILGISRDSLKYHMKILGLYGNET